MAKENQNWKMSATNPKFEIRNSKLPPWFLHLLINRGLTSKKEIEAYLAPKYEDLYSSGEYVGVDRAVERLRAAKDKEEKVVVYGDYDVDGITATAIVFEALRKIGVQNLETYIPHREEEGYGLNAEALAGIKKAGTTLVVAVDCGITAGEIIDSQNGLDVIVIDHHTIDEKKLSQKAICLHPLLRKGRIPFREGDSLSAAGMCFVLVRALQDSFPEEFPAGQEKWLLDLVALSTICDIVPLMGQNRILAHYGLKVLQKTRREGLKALADVSGVELSEADSYTVGFLLGPRLNAAGRLESAQKALDLIMAESAHKARPLAIELNKLNIDRQLLCERIVEEARQQVEKGDKNVPIHLLSDKGWPRGVVGIVASRITDQYGKPTIIFEDDGEQHHGSARSVDGLDITEIILEVSDYVIKFGGHAKAAGLTVGKDHFVVFKEKLYALVGEKLKDIELKKELVIDGTLEVDEINDDAMSLLAQLEPTGYGNKRPILAAMGVKVANISRVGKAKEHLKFRIKGKNKVAGLLEAVAFNEAREPKEGVRYDVAFTLKYNVWNNHRNIEARVIDFRESK